MSPNPKLIDKWLASLPREPRRALSRVIATADASNTPLYLVGGPLRDLLVDRTSLDIDLVAEGDAIELAQRAAPTLEASVKTHPTFGTATIILPSPGAAGGHGAAGRGAGGEGALGTRHSALGTFSIDIATARTETYARPGALPKTTPASIEEDLVRRDFTINAIALRLNGPDRGELLDPTGGLADIGARVIRILHGRSLQDDPTRILRAARYAVRFGFRIERRTLTRLRRDAHYLARVSGARLHHEFSRIFDEPAPETILRQLDRLGVLTAIHPALRFERPEARTFEQVRKLVAAAPSGLPPTARAACWPPLALRLSSPDGTSLATRLALTNSQRAAVEAMPRLRDLLLPSPARGRGTPAAGGLGEGTRSALAALLSPFPLPAILAFAAAATNHSIRTRLLDYLTTARHIHPILRGDDLIALRVTRGPAVGDTLRRLRAAKLDGKVKTKTDEIHLVQAIYKAGDLKGGSVVGQ